MIEQPIKDGQVAVSDEQVASTLASKGAGGEIGLFSPISFCHWQAPKYGNTGELMWNTAFKAAQLAIAIANSIAQQEIADKQFDLADKWLNHAKYKWERFWNNYAPLEKQLLREVANTDKPTLDCDSAASRARDSSVSAYDIMERYMRQKAKAYSLCMDNSLYTDINTQRSLLQIDTENYNYADDRWYKDFKEDQRWNRRSVVLDLGRNNSATAKAYGDVAGKIYQGISTQLNQIGQGAIYSLGYFGARNDTYMPNTYLGSGGNGVGGSIVSIGMPNHNIAGTTLNAAP